MQRTQELNKCMPRLKGNCMFHFVGEERLVADHFPSCEYMNQSFEKGYNDFRQSFRFPAKFEYCYSCGTPQDNQKNGECPKFHVNLAFGKCGYNHILFRTAFCIWQSPKLRGEMVRDLKIAGSISSQEDFAKWAQEIEAADGKYHNCSEAFLWFCRRLEKRRPSFFM